KDCIRNRNVTRVQTCALPILQIELLDCPIRRKNGQYKLQIKLNPSGQSDKLVLFTKKVKDSNPASPVVYSLDLSDLEWPNPVVEPMLYSVEADLKVPDEHNEQLEYSYRTRSYLRVERQNILFLEPWGFANPSFRASWQRYG